MSCAPPPPPPPAPTLPAFSAKPAGKDDRSMLLESIRKGTKLKKTVTVDKSAPLIAGNTSTKSSSNFNNAANARITTNNRPVNDAPTTGGLGGLFVNGIPKLKATGLPIGQAYQQYRNETDAPKSNVIVNNNNRNNNVNNLNRSTSSITKTRGPPPQPPGLPPKNISPDADSTDGLAVHSRCSSTASLNENHSYQTRTSNGVAHVISHGKPSLAPKPPGFSVNNDGRHSVTRTQSMRIPRSPISTNETKNGPQFPDYNQSELHGINNKNGFPSFHQSQESLSKRNHRQSSPSRMPWSSVSMNNVNATLRPHNRSHGSLLRPPLSKPPPPPSVRSAVSPPMCPPPPPPTHPPPRPPHRVNPAPPPPTLRSTNNFSNDGVPPTPPTRYSSIRNSNTSSFESRFLPLFHSADEFPSPQPYRSCMKIYNSSIKAKQQAPQPPMQFQSNRSWPCENTSNC